MKRTHLDLFSGIGGFALAARWCGVETVAFCEIEPYAQQVIVKNFGASLVANSRCFIGRSENTRQKERSESGVEGGGKTLPVSNAIGCDGGQNYKRKAAAKRNGASPLDDSKGVGCGEAGQEQSPPSNRPRLHGNIFNLNGADYAGVWLLTGGFPCQPFSFAGKRLGKEDDRAIWPEMFRVIKEARPTWIIAENVAGIASMVQFDSQPRMASDGGAEGTLGEIYTRNGTGYLHEVLESIESAGYAVQTLVIPAYAVDAKHRRDRVWIVAHAEENGGESWPSVGAVQEGNGSVLTNTNKTGLQVERGSREGSREGGREGATVVRGHRSAAVWCPEPNVGGGFNGLSGGLDRIMTCVEQSHKLLLDYGKTSNQRPSEILRSLRNTIDQKDVQWTAGRCNSVSPKEILFAYLCQLETLPIDKARLQLAGEKTSEAGLRSVRATNKPSRSPSRPRHQQQSSAEHPDTLQALSRLLAQHSQEAWQRNRWQDAAALPWGDGWEVGLQRVATGVPRRVDRLKGLGNSIVPQVAAQIIAAMIAAED